MPYLAPLGWQHINLTGDYIWTEPSETSRARVSPAHGVEFCTTRNSPPMIF